MTIRTKLILWYSGLLAVIIVFFGVAVFAVMRWTLISAVEQTLWDTSEQILSNTRVMPVAETGSPVVAINVQLPSLDFFRASNVGVQVFEMQGGEAHLYVASSNLQGHSEPLDAAALGRGEGTVSSVQLADGTDVRVLTRPIMVQRQIIGNVQVAASLQTVNQATDKLLGIMLVGGGLAVLGSIALGMWLSDRALKPIDDITQAAAHIANAEDLSMRLPWNGPMDELGRLTSVYNSMMDRLEKLFSVQRRFVADVSHELRTPLTAIRGNLDLIRRYGSDEASLEAIDSEASRMSRMVGDLLLLARADAGGMAIELDVVDVDTVVAEVYKQAQVLAKDRQLEINLGPFEPVRVRGSSDRLQQLLLNLVSNALKFTADGGKITLCLMRNETHAILQVRDTGVGIAAEHLPRIFDRFYQAEPSRTRENPNEGAGLGLSIARWIADAHHGKIEVESKEGQGTVFTVLLPLENAAAEGIRHPTRPSLSALAARVGVASVKGRSKRDESDPEPG